MSDLHVFDAAVALEPLDDGHESQYQGHYQGRYQGHTHPAWANMIGPYGGITAAVLLNAACIDPRRLGEPLSLTVNYAGPVADGPFIVEAQPARTNRGSQHWVITQRQGDSIATTATAVFAVRRDTWEGSEAQMPHVRPAAALTTAARRSVRAAWIDNYDIRFAFGAWPDLLKNPVPEADGYSGAWLRDQPPRPLDVVSLASLCDLFYPRIFRRRPKLVPIGTVSMTSYFHATAAELAQVGTQHVFASARGQRYHRGFFDHTGHLWAPTGELLATTHQVVYYKE